MAPEAGPNPAAICFTGRPEVLVVSTALGRQVGHDAFQEGALDFEILGHGFDHPIALAQLGEVVFEVAGGDEGGRPGS